MEGETKVQGDACIFTSPVGKMAFLGLEIKEHVAFGILNKGCDVL